MKKHAVSAMALALCLLNTGLPAAEMTAVAASDDLTYGALTYTQENGGITITKCDDKAETVEIPAEIDGLPVTKIGATAFYGCALTSVIIPEGVTEIASGAFWHSKNLTEVSLPSTLTTIEGFAFNDCPLLASISFPESLTAVGNNAFGDTAWIAAQQAVSPFVTANHILIDASAVITNALDEVDAEKIRRAQIIEDAKTWERAGILTNQIGYFPNLDKKATLLSDAAEGVEFNLLDEAGNIVYTNVSQPMGLDADSGDSVHVLDFSDFKKTGTYTLRTKDGAESRAFQIGVQEAYSGLVYDALNYFYQNRSGIEIEEQYITSGNTAELARAAGHVSDIAAVQRIWGYKPSTVEQDVSGGWYDAGDHGKYVVNGGISLWLMQNQYERALLNGTTDAYQDGAMKIPENGNGIADLLDESRWEMEWMLKMIVQDGDCKDMAYHKVHDIKWTALAVAPADDPEERILKPPTTAATLNLAACGAQAYRLWKDIDPTFAEQCLTAARNAYDAAKNHPDMYAPLDESIGGGAYGDDDATDEFYWAACELYTSIGEDRYYKDMQNSTHFLEVPTALNGGESVGVVGSFDWGHTASLGSLTMILNKEKLTEQEASTLEDNITSAGTYFLNLENKQGYGIPYGQSTISYDDSDKGYVWGSNSFVADNAIIMAYAYDLSRNTDFLSGVSGAMDYLLGRNPMDYSYVTGYGTHSVQYPHHRWWSNLLSDNFPKAPCGVLVGGCNSGMEDPWVRGSGWKKGQIAPQKCYLDHIEAWSVNECTINWNTPLAWVTAYLLEQNEGIIAGHASMGTNDGGNGTSNPDSSNSVDNSAPSTTPAETSSAPTSAQNDSSVAENAVTPSEVNEVAETSANAGNSDSSADERTTPEVPEKTSNNKVPWIVGGCLIGLISIEIFAYKMIKMMKDKK